MPTLGHSADRLSPKLWIVGLIILVGFSRHLPLDYPGLFQLSPPPWQFSCFAEHT